MNLRYIGEILITGDTINHIKNGEIYFRLKISIEGDWVIISRIIYIFKRNKCILGMNA